MLPYYPSHRRKEVARLPFCVIRRIPLGTALNIYFPKFYYFCWLKPENVKNFRNFIAFGLMLLFCTYYAGISMFAHTHISNGTSVVHSHLGGGSDHDHSDSQYAVIDILSNLQSEEAAGVFFDGAPFLLLSESFIGYQTPSFLTEAHPVYTLRGPPQA